MNLFDVSVPIDATPPTYPGPGNTPFRLDPLRRITQGASFHEDYVGVTESGVRHLLEHGIKLVGVDYLSVEPFRRPGAPAHRALLGGGTIVIEGLNLRDVEAGVCEMIGPPRRGVDSDGAPAGVVLCRS